MDALDWRFPAILVGAMLLGLLLTWVQMRSYNAELNRALRAVRGEHLVLVSGRGRSLAGGAIVIAVVDTRARRVIRARALAGRSVFARFHDAPELVGDLTGAVDRVRGRQLKAAVEMALAQVDASAAADDPAPTTTNNAPVPATGPRPIRRRVPHTTSPGAAGTRSA